MSDTKQRSSAARIVRAALFIFVGIFVLGNVLLLIDGANQPGESVTNSESAATKAPGPDLEVEHIEWKVSQFGSRMVVGTVKNQSSKTFRYAQVELNLYDEAGSQVGSTLANVNNLEPGSTWKFEAIVLADSATTAKVKGVTGF